MTEPCFNEMRSGDTFKLVNSALALGIMVGISVAFSSPGRSEATAA